MCTDRPELLDIGRALQYRGRIEFEFGTNILRIRLWFGYKLE